MKKKIKKTYITLLLMITTLMGLRAQELDKLNFNLPGDLQLLEKQINNYEKSTPGIKPGCEAKIVWADSTKKVKTSIAFLYIHGFSASQMECAPIHRNLAKKFAANLYLARLVGHGIELGDSTMAKVSADSFAHSAEYALAIAKTLGDEVIIISSSFGGALSCWLASRHPEIKSLVLYSPCMRVEDKRAEMIAQPGAVQSIIQQYGSAIVEFQPINEEFAKYWTTRYHLNGLAAFQIFLFREMNKETFEKIKCPVFMGYWYKNEKEKDTTVSIPAMMKMFEELSSEIKQKFAFPNAGNHTLSTPILSKDIESVQRETEKFLKGIL
jgi:esterase/lipase